MLSSREIVRNLKLTNGKEFRACLKGNTSLSGIPSAPWRVFKEWKGINDWLGTEISRYTNRKFLPFEEAREYVRKLGLLTVSEWESYHKSEKLPPNVPTTPRRTYVNKGWKGFGDWLGTNTVAPQNKEYSSFKEAREFVHKLQLTGQSKWFEYARSEKRPPNIPIAPHLVYENDWKDWGDWLGTWRKATQEKGWSIDKVKKLLQSLIVSGIIYTWTEARLYTLLLTKGVLNLQYENRHSQFFKNLIQARHTEEGRKAIEESAYSGTDVVPDLLKVTTDPNKEEIPTASSEELAKLVNDGKDPLDYGEIPTVQQILSSTRLLESINVDEEAMQFFVLSCINDIWKRAFKEEEKTVLEIKKEGKNGNKFHDLIVETFLYEYENTRNIRLPNDYSFPEKPTLMQKFIAYKISTRTSFGNFSGTGAGKTLSVVLLIVK